MIWSQDRVGGGIGGVFKFAGGRGGQVAEGTAGGALFVFTGAGGGGTTRSMPLNHG